MHIKADIGLKKYIDKNIIVDYFRGSYINNGIQMKLHTTIADADRSSLTGTWVSCIL